MDEAEALPEKSSSGIAMPTERTPLPNNQDEIKANGTQNVLLSEIEPFPKQILAEVADSETGVSRLRRLANELGIVDKKTIHATLIAATSLASISLIALSCH
ncbi:MAG: hypothetical protein AB7G28_19700 [Pirellulales bacterium]